MLIWVLTDDRVGSNNQSLGLANALSKNVIIKKIKYNFFIFLPNFIRFSTLLGINKKESDNIETNFPDIVISAGRRLSPLLLNIKKKSKNTIIINIMNPNMNFNKFDLIIIPKHDNINKHYNNVIETYGVLNKINKEIIENEAKIHNSLFQKYKKPFISLIVGGDTKSYKFDILEFKKMIINLSNLIHKMNGTLLITTSRRTNEKCIDIIENNILSKHYFYNWKLEKGDNNPYLSILGLSNFIITTADSISMISESCCTGKPVYVYKPIKNISKKHNRFFIKMIQDGYIKEFTSTTSILENYSYTPLNEINRVSNIIKRKYDL